MDWNYEQLADFFSRERRSRWLLEGKWGLEKEAQRVTPLPLSGSKPPG